MQRLDFMREKGYPHVFLRVNYSLVAVINYVYCVAGHIPLQSHDFSGSFPQYMASIFDAEDLDKGCASCGRRSAQF